MNCSCPYGMSGARCVTWETASVRVETTRANGSGSWGGRRDMVNRLTASASSRNDT